LLGVYSCNPKVFDKNLKAKAYDQHTRLDSQFVYYFNILDSIASIGFIDSTLRATEAISFMEFQTRIEGEADGTFFGKLYFTQEDLDKWKKWYAEYLEEK